MRHCAVTVLVAVILGLCTQSALAQADEATTPTQTGPGYVWWEGEDAVEANFPPASEAPRQDGLPGSAREILSGGDWLLASGPVPEGGFGASYRIEVPEGGEYELWARVGWRGWAGNEWRFDEDDWKLASADDSFHQAVHFAQFRPASWTLVDRVTLEPGTHTFQIRIAGQAEALQGFDCFVLAKRPFVPLGKYRPDETIDTRPLREGGGGWWPFQPPYLPDATKGLDLSTMNAPVDEHGFVEMRDGELFFADGEPVRFWGINTGYHNGHMVFPTHATADRMAEHFARIGVNCVRIHVLHAANSLIDPTRDDTQHFNEDRLDRLEYWVAALRKKGIYINLDLVFHREFKAGDEIDFELTQAAAEEGYNVSWAAGSAALFHPRAIELNRVLYRKLLERTNPYTGLRWLDDPQMAMLTIQNEQSIFWGTTNIHKGAVRELLDRLYTDWLRQRYASQAELAEAWQVPDQRSPFEEGEDLDEGVIRLGQVGVQSAPHLVQRGLDQIRFLYDVETGFYRDTLAAMREWGVQCPIITSNWAGAGQTTRLVLQASALGGIVDRHDYFNAAQSMLAQVGRGIPGSAFDQVAGRGFSISEWNHGVDGQYAPETMPLVATVGAFQGWDALFQFTATSPTWETYLRGLNVTAAHQALYPAAALIFRRQDIRPGEVVYERRRDPAWQFSFEREQRRVPAELLAIGRVLNVYVDEPQDDLLRQDMVDELWDREQGICRANTGQFEWRYGEGWMRLDAERTQGAFGAIGGRAIECPDVTVQTPNAFCAILVQSLDGQAIPQASRLLVSAAGRAMNQQAGDEGDQAQPPCLMEPVTGTVSVRTPATRVYALSAFGDRLDEVDAQRDGEQLRFELTGEPQVLFYELTGE